MIVQINRYKIQYKSINKSLISLLLFIIMGHRDFNWSHLNAQSDFVY